MKNIVTLLVLVVLLSSCSNDDVFENDPIVGKWSYEYVNGYEITDCKSNDYEQFNSDGSYFRTDCKEDYPYKSGFWRHIEGNSYLIEYKDVRGGVYSKNVIVQFTDENTMRFHYQIKVYELKRIGK